MFRRSMSKDRRVAADDRRFGSTYRVSGSTLRRSMSKDRCVVADDRRFMPTGRFSSDEDHCYLSSYLFPLEEDRCQRSTVRFQRTNARFVVDADRALGSAAVAPGPAPRCIGTTSLDIVPFTRVHAPTFLL
jgi:hypothetical protein